jgi:hypothetical protein
MVNERKDWRIVQEIKAGLTEGGAREFLREYKQTDYLYAVSSTHDLIMGPDGPLTSGRAVPEFHYE